MGCGKVTKDQSDYFREKRIWSKTKDSLLCCYLTPFFEKTYGYSQDGYVYVDAFAGAGVFDNGEEGSPIIAIKKLLAAAHKRSNKCCAQFIFGEANAGARTKLKDAVYKACGNVNYLCSPILCNSFEEAIEAAQTASPRPSKKPATVFYYVDPYGVKDLRLDLFCRSPNFAHTEALVNFNTVGFMRDGAAALRIALELPADVSVVDHGFDDNVPMTERILRLNDCIGSDDWQDILTQHGLDYWERERLIGQLFCRNARRSFQYVTNMPIKDMARMVNRGGEIKYRLVHMTNNVDGCLLMNDNMLKRNNNEQVQQGALFKVDIDQCVVNISSIKFFLEEYIADLPLGKSFNMGVFAAAIVNEYGVFDTTNALLKTYLGPLLDNGLLVRDEPYTPKTHKPKKSFGKKDKVHRV